MRSQGSRMSAAPRAARMAEIAMPKREPDAHSGYSASPKPARTGIALTILGTRGGSNGTSGASTSTAPMAVAASSAGAPKTEPNPRTLTRPTIANPRNG